MEAAVEGKSVTATVFVQIGKHYCTAREPELGLHVEARGIFAPERPPSLETKS
jgi:hypothetical protein